MTDELLAGCRAGNPKAWQHLFDLYTTRIYRWAVLRGLRGPEAEDLAQEVLATAWRRIDRCESPEAVTSWLYQITRRQVANARRKAWFRRVLVGAAVPEQVCFEGENAHARAVRSCLARVEPELAEVLVLSDIEGHTRGEVAVMTGLAPGTVASRLRRARAAFSTHWLEAHPDERGAS
jgi:RNA polymerase sigma-70 factor (ECF subfamily)